MQKNVVCLRVFFERLELSIRTIIPEPKEVQGRNTLSLDEMRRDETRRGGSQTKTISTKTKLYMILVSGGVDLISQVGGPNNLRGRGEGRRIMSA